jgi:cystathionine gamma-synthase
MLGAVAGTEPFIQEVLAKMMVWGQAPDPFAAWLLERGLKTLDVRVRRQNDNAMRIATWCADRKEVKRVHYPGLLDHPDHEVARALMDGYGGMLAIEVSGGGKGADRFLRRLKLIQHAASLGGVDSLVSEPRYTSHARLSSEERARLGVPDGFVRLSVGIEDADDLIADIEQALK